MAETFTDRDLTDARFDRCLLNGAVLRGVDVDGMDIDAPWLLRGGTLLVNGVDVVPYVEAQLAERFPGWADRTATTPDGLRSAWASVQSAWGAALERAEGLPVDEQVDGEWSFAQTLRHLVMATDIWLRGAVLEVENPLSPLGQPFAEYATDGYDTSVFVTEQPSYDEVLAVRAQRVGMVTDYLASATEEDLAAPCRHPWAPDREIPALHCLHTVIDEEWSHLRFALRDLDALEAPAP